MLARMVVVVSLLALSSSAMAKEGYVACWIENGEAKISLCVENGSASESGRLNFTARDRQGRKVDSGWCIGVGIAISGCDEMCSESVDEDAVFCTASWD